MHAVDKALELDKNHFHGPHSLKHFNYLIVN